MREWRGWLAVLVLAVVVLISVAIWLREVLIPPPWRSVQGPLAVGTEGVAEMAFCDYVQVCPGGYCGAGSSGGCNPGLRMVGHTNRGGDVAFRILLRDELGNVLGDSARTDVFGGYYQRAGGLLSQRCDAMLTTSAKNPGGPYASCEFRVFTYGAGGYPLTRILGWPARYRSLHRYPEVTYLVEVVASAVKVERTPDGKLLDRWAVGSWNWDAACRVPLRVEYVNGRYLCYQAESGELPRYQAPVISRVVHQVANPSPENDYAQVTITFETDVPARGRVYYSVQREKQPCDPFSGWSSPVTSEGTSHAAALDSATLWYGAEEKVYCYRVVAWLERYRYVEQARSIEPTLDAEPYTFVIGGGGQ